MKHRVTVDTSVQLSTVGGAPSRTTARSEGARHPHEHVEHRHVEVPPEAGTVSFDERGEDGDGGEHGADLIGE